MPKLFFFLISGFPPLKPYTEIFLNQTFSVSPTGNTYVESSSTYQRLWYQTRTKNVSLVILVDPSKDLITGHNHRGKIFRSELNDRTSYTITDVTLECEHCPYSTLVTNNIRKRHFFTHLLTQHNVPKAESKARYRDATEKLIQDRIGPGCFDPVPRTKTFRHDVQCKTCFMMFEASKSHNCCKSKWKNCNLVARSQYFTIPFLDRCFICAKNFLRRKELENHIRDVHADYKCTKCGAIGIGMKKACDCNAPIVSILSGVTRNNLGRTKNRK